MIELNERSLPLYPIFGSVSRSYAIYNASTRERVPSSPSPPPFLDASFDMTPFNVLLVALSLSVGAQAQGYTGAFTKAGAQ